MASTPPPAVDVAPGLVERARRGDHRAFVAIVRHHDASLRSLAYRMLGDRERMDDVLQDVYLKAFRGFPSFRGDASAGTWLYRIAYNACLDDLRRRPPEALALEQLGQTADGRPDAGTLMAERDRVARALAALPARQRAAVLLVDGQGFDYATAGAALGVPAGTVASRLNAARAALRLTLGADDPEEAKPDA